MEKIIDKSGLGDGHCGYLPDGAHCHASLPVLRQSSFLPTATFHLALSPCRTPCLHEDQALGHACTISCTAWWAVTFADKSQESDLDINMQKKTVVW